jgi:hypothetical protein
MASSLLSTLQSLGLSEGAASTVSGIGGVLSGFYASSQLGEAANQALVGGNLTALSYKDAGESALEYADFNTKVNTLNLSMQLADLSSQQAYTASLQKTQMAVSGVSLSSQSYLSVAAASLDAYDQKKQSLRQATSISNDVALFQGQLAKTQALNQANQAQYQSEVNAKAYNQQKDSQDLSNFFDVAAGIASFIL